MIVPFPKFLNEERTNVEFKTPVLMGGGTGANTAVALSRLGLEVSFVGTIGADNYGKYIIEDLQQENINTENLIIDKELNTVGVFAFIDEYGERYLWGWPRTKQSFKELDLQKVDLDEIKNADWIHSSGMVLVAESSAREAVLEIFKLAYEAGVTTSFDLNLRVDNGRLDKDYKDTVLEIMEYCNYVLGSGEEEFYYLKPEENWLDSAKYFASETRTIIARMGAGGSMAITPDQCIEVPGYKVEVCDTVGAGDVYNGGFIAARLAGCSLLDSVRLGNAVAGYKVSKEGARNSPKIEELEEFLQTHEKEGV
ncbi:MAG TPA: sugar kinase [Halanaerobiaceae bacterium]|nr:sugar kinase [Halanaerobiaceae bacterium]